MFYFQGVIQSNFMVAKPVGPNPSEMSAFLGFSLKSYAFADLTLMDKQLCWHPGLVNNRAGMNQAQNANQLPAAVLPAV